MKKHCVRCDQMLDVDAFSYKVKSKGTRQPYCKPCAAEYRREHYAANKEYYCEKAKRYDKKHRDTSRAWLLNYLSTRACVDCGENDPVVLEFDHREDKKFSIGNFSKHKLSIARLEKEVAKCDVRCANCHRRKTAKERGWWRHSAGVAE